MKSGATLTHRRQPPDRTHTTNNTATPNPSSTADANLLSSSDNNRNSMTVEWVAALYVFSGICQPLLMTQCQMAGLADSKAQLYMLFYYLGPSFCIVTMLHKRDLYEKTPSLNVVFQASGIALFDICAQTLNYTGAALAGATIFAVVYSSVTVWTAVISRIVLGRTLNATQWWAVLLVFVGLCVTAVDSSKSLGGGGDGEDTDASVSRGTLLIVIGSAMHGATYVLSESIMMTTAPSSNDSSSSSSPTHKRHHLMAHENSAIQSVVACTGFLVWQWFYTLPRFKEVILQPMEEAKTSVWKALLILCSFGIANLLHSLSFYFTLKHYPGGSTSAGVMKGLQAVLVFIAAHCLYCRSNAEMCFSWSKLTSLLFVVGGVWMFKVYNTTTVTLHSKGGYTRIDSEGAPVAEELS